ncbi:MAG: hypothetical protein U5K28_04835 [Halobacteriales archaeon]|nr:hypothetical protein [Halobacteriales archaeon]
MVPALRTVLVGRPRSRFRWALDVFVSLSILVGTFGAYALGLFQVSGGVIVLPAAATLVGFVVAVGVGVRRGGLLVAWLGQFAAYIGFRADWAFWGFRVTRLAGSSHSSLTQSDLLCSASLPSSSVPSDTVSDLSADRVSNDSEGKWCLSSPMTEHALSAIGAGIFVGILGVLIKYVGVMDLIAGYDPEKLQTRRVLG